MAHLSVNQANTSAKRDCPLPIADTYADAILRTLSSFKPPSPPILQYRRSHSHTKTTSQAEVNEVSGLKTCIHLYVLHFIFKWKLMGGVTRISFFFSSFFSVMSSRDRML